MLNFEQLELTGLSIPQSCKRVESLSIKRYLFTFVPIFYFVCCTKDAVFNLPTNEGWPYSLGIIRRPHALYSSYIIFFCLFYLFIYNFEWKCGLCLCVKVFVLLAFTISVSCWFCYFYSFHLTLKYSFSFFLKLLTLSICGNPFGTLLYASTALWITDFRPNKTERLELRYSWWQARVLWPCCSILLLMFKLLRV